VAAAGLRLGATFATSAVESIYSRGAYPRIVASLSTIAAVAPFATAEPLLLAAVLLTLAWVVRGLRKTRERRWRLAGLRCLGLVAWLYLSFLIVWGLNYERRPLAASAGLDVRSPRVQELADVASALVEGANRLRAGVGEDVAGVFRADGGLRGVLTRAPAGLAHAAAACPSLSGFAPPPKAPWASGLLSLLGISGIYSPFTAEPLVDAEIPDSDLPFAASHEMAHGLGFAREDEANYIASLACRLHPDADFRYSGTVIASAYVLSALVDVDPTSAERLRAARSVPVQRDLAALAAWSARHEGRVSRASRRVNDAYLRSNGQREGIDSYGRFVDLLVAERRKGGRLLAGAS
jgi:hypothetical protein